MKQFLFYIIFSLCFTFQVAYTQETPEQTIMIDANTVVKDEKGNRVEIFKLMDYINSGEYTIYPVNDAAGKMLYMQLKKATEEEKSMMKKLSNTDLDSDANKTPNFKMTDLNGNEISSENTKGKVVVLNFWFTACKPCVAEIPELNEVYEKYKDNTEVVFAAVTFDNEKVVQPFLKKFPLHYPVVANANDICDSFKIMGYPTNIVLDKKGNIYDKKVGGFPQIGKQLANTIQAAIEGKEVPENTPPEGLVLDTNAQFKLENGQTIPFEKALELLQTNKYDLKPKEKEGKKSYILIEK